MTRKMLFRRAVAEVAKEETVPKPDAARVEIGKLGDRVVAAESEVRRLRGEVRRLRRELRGIVRKAGDYCSPWEQSDIAEAALAPRRRKPK